MLTAKLFLVYLLQSMSINDVVDIEETYCLAKNIYYESRGESIQGQIAVASVTLNRVKDPRFPSSICEVVKQTAIHRSGKKVCAFSWYCEYNKTRDIILKNADGTPRAQTIEDFKESSIVAINVISGRIKDNTDGATHFHNPYLSNPAWAKTMTMTRKLGNHNFYK